MKRLLTITCLCTSLCVNAQESPAVGEDEVFFVPWKPQSRGMYQDKTILAWKKGAGVTLNDFVAFEGSMYDFDYDGLLRYSPYDAQGYRESSDYTVNVLGVGKLPISKRFSLFVKAGPTYYNMDSSIDPLFSPTGDEALEMALSYSTGARFIITPHLNLSLEYMQTQADIIEGEGSVAQINWNF